jgi:hypothetical protein
MKRLLIGTMILTATSINAFSAEKRIECMSENKKIHVALVGSNAEFDAVETLTIIKGGVFGKDQQIQNPNCMVIPRQSEKGLFVIVNCEEQKLLVNQFLAKGSDGEATLKSGLRRYSLSCKSN